MGRSSTAFSGVFRRPSNKTGTVKGFGKLRPDVRHQFEKMKSRMILEASGGGPRTVLFTSYHHGEGTTTVLTNFARSLAQEKRYKTLIVDANTRTPALQSPTQDGNGDGTFSELFITGVEKTSLPKPSKEANLSVMPSGNTVHHPSEVFDHRRFAKFIRHVKKLFHFVLLDSSPIGKYYDSVVLGSHVDGVILVVEAEKTRSHELKWAKQLYRDREIPILGVVLNRRRFHIPRFVFDRFLG